MRDKPNIARRIGTALNKPDLDFSRLTLAGWLATLLSVGTGGGVAYFVCSAMIRRNGLNLAAGVTCCVTIIAVTTVVFLGLRWCFGLVGHVVNKPNSVPSECNKSNLATLKRMSNAGIDMKGVHAIDFWHLFKTRKIAEDMGRKARQQSYDVVSIEPNDESGGYDVHIRIDLVPTLTAITAAEQTLASIAEQCHGHADGWGVRQKS